MLLKPFAVEISALTTKIFMRLPNLRKGLAVAKPSQWYLPFTKTLVLSGGCLGLLRHQPIGLVSILRLW
jgi:hypothetical protein